MRKIKDSLLALLIIPAVLFSTAMAGNIQQGWLGIYTQTLDEDLKEAFDLNRDSGVIVKYVIPNSPAEEAGLEQGDIIIKIDNSDLDNSSLLSEKVKALDPGDEVDLVIIRDGKEKDVMVTLGSIDDSGDKRGSIHRVPGKQHTYTKTFDHFKSFMSGTSYIGVTLESLTQQLGEYFGVENGKGVLITEVAEDSPAEKAGLKAGDVIVGIDNKEIESIDEVQKAVRAKETGEKVELTVIRDRKEKEFAVEVEESPDMWGMPDIHKLPALDDFYFFAPKMKGMYRGDYDDSVFDKDELKEQMKSLQEQMDKLGEEMKEIRKKLE